MDNMLKISAARRITNVRSEILREQPFLGRLIMKLPCICDKCGTAYTDMKKIVFDPEFADKLGDAELKFVLLHELMHCVLKHCTRARGKIQFIYNIACDIVVNSIILEAMGLDDIIIAEVPAMHLAPDGNEGRLFSADEIYGMIMSAESGDSPLGKSQSGYGSSGSDSGGGETVDSHNEWEEIECEEIAEANWDKNVKDSIKACGLGNGLPSTLRRALKIIERNPKIDWRIVLREFIQADRGGYTFSPPDKKLLQYDIILPEYQSNVYGSRVDDLWFAIDTSGSVNDKGISEAMGEIKDAMEQIGSMRGSVSFFDHMVYEPFEFESVEELYNLKPVGGGGTSFRTIFKYLSDNAESFCPRAIVILTDGYADFSTEDAAMGIPVIWCIINSEITPPFGEVIHIYTE